MEEKHNNGRGLSINLDHEQKIIRVGCFFHQLKGELICESTEANTVVGGIPAKLIKRL